MSFFVSFRILCWQLLWFADDRAKNLHPDYFNCNRCHREEKDLRRGCPKCPLTEKLEYYKEETLSFICKEKVAFPKRYTLDKLIRLHGQIASLLAANRNRLQKLWDIRTAALARILLSEREQKRAVDDFEFRQRMKK